MGAIRYSIDEKLIQFFKLHLPLDIFVETGTFNGDTLEIAESYFQACFSVEIAEEYFRIASERFKDKENIFIDHGDSSEKLANIIEDVRQASVLYWLDAHDCSNVITPEVNGMAAQTPILSELASIGMLNEQSVLVIDDARLYLNGPPPPNTFRNWPDMQDIFLALLSMSETHRIGIYDDTIVYYPESLKEVYRQFAHQSSVDTLGAMLDARTFREQQKDGTKSDTKAPGGLLKKFIKRD